MNTYYTDGEPISTFVKEYFSFNNEYFPHKKEWKQVHHYPADLVFVFGSAAYSSNMKNTKGSTMLSLLDGSSKEILTNKILFSLIYSKNSFIPRFDIVYNSFEIAGLFKRKKFLENPVILKPLGSFSGENIIVSDNKKELIDWMDSKLKSKFPDQKTKIKLTAWVFQDYIRNPALYKKFKFHIRVIIVPIKRGISEPIEIYMTKYNRMVCAGEPYKASDWQNEDIHDTHIRRNSLTPYFLINNPDGWNDNDVNIAFRKIVNIFKKIFGEYNDFKPTWGAKGGFELLGADVMFDEDKHPYIIEINSKTGFHHSQKFVIPSILDLVLNKRNDGNMIELYNEKTSIVEITKNFDNALFVDYSVNEYFSAIKCDSIKYILVKGEKKDQVYDKEYIVKDLSEGAKKLKFLYDMVIEAKPFAKVYYIPNSGIIDNTFIKKSELNEKVRDHIYPEIFTKTSLDQIYNWIDNTDGSRIVFLSITFCLSQIKMHFAPQFQWRSRDSDLFWANVDKSISREKRNITLSELIKTFYSIYKNSHKYSLPYDYFKDITINDYVEYFYGGKERVSMLQKLFEKLEKEKIKIVFLSSNWAVHISPKLIQETLNVFIPSKNYEMHYVGYESNWNKVLKIYMLKYDSLCKTKKHKKRSNITLKKSRK